ncbi:hypothetical protein GJR96_06745 [Haloferax sp. MBLA0076]|uniref:Blue (type 1) copper domain-containing protein n=1 Tax=Haloferax litoreum TaxID=2666140 RepID=A0A6A8GEU1_9EURY|nr:MULTISPECIES: plastocyanin/azurin family copper-binding protein [Haloferax]KAB1193157.1 hypothetical protein Hfx1148_06735 [Haloferax sp. CBA1148]MRX21653.1 hypothetical protein [Haloferax litoreum]
MSDIELHRRQFLLLAGTTTVTGLAGCTTAPVTTDGQGSEGQTTTTDTGGAGAEVDDHHVNDHHGESEHHVDDHHGGDEHHDDEESAERVEDSHEHDEQLTGPLDSADVGMVTTATGHHFEPHICWVDVGGTVTWTNERGFHSTTSYSPENYRPQLTPDGTASWNSEIITEGGVTFEKTFEMPGVYHYFCLPHEFVGMIGSVIVGTPDPEGEPALTDPPAELADPIRERLRELNAAIHEALEHAA